jgi:hypothetical protein
MQDSSSGAVLLAQQGQQEMYGFHKCIVEPYGFLFSEIHYFGYLG